MVTPPMSADELIDIVTTATPAVEAAKEAREEADREKRESLAKIREHFASLIVASSAESQNEEGRSK
jgi:hypothetical protein